eukprot:TRINITY_DN19580_c0_g1_i1.p1 TRINITY_DN19580_c0_g1~~TRINITY_DN19580_c0_g1_i1.p1  ORF type:complete len:315 (-),score=73.97 TRINITY_DN19580_c0_g1_i1:21-911(-)
MDSAPISTSPVSVSVDVSDKPRDSLQSKPRTRPSSDFAAAINRSSDGTIFLTIDELIDNKRKYPLDRQSFADFMRSRHSEENFLFLVEIHEWRMAAFDRDLTEKIVEKYVRDGSRQQVNLPARIQKAILNSWEAGNNPGLFDEAEGEIVKMFQTNMFINSFLVDSLRNIDELEARIRMKIAIGNLLLWMAMSIVLSLSCASIWYRLFCFLPAFMGIGQAVQSWSRFCFAMGFAGKKVACGMDWIQTMKDKEGGKLLDDQVRKTHHKKTLKIFMYVLGLTSILVGISFALPQHVCYF